MELRLSFVSLLTLIVLLFQAATALPNEIIALNPRAGGGGGRGGGGGGGGSSGGSSGGKPSGGSSSSSSGGSSSSGSRGTTSPARYGSGGGLYAGGAAVPITAGAATSRGLASRPLLLSAGFVGGISAGYFIAQYPYGGYVYDYDNAVTYQNASAGNETVRADVECICAKYSPCGCDENDDDGYVQSLIGDGSYATLMTNKVIVTGANGTNSSTPGSGRRGSNWKGHADDGTNATLVIDGTLQNGTTSAAGMGMRAAASGAAGWGFLAAAVLAAGTVL